MLYFALTNCSVCKYESSMRGTLKYRIGIIIKMRKKKNLALEGAQNAFNKIAQEKQ